MNITYEDFKDYCSSGLVNYSLQDFTAFSIMFDKKPYELIEFKNDNFGKAKTIPSSILSINIHEPKNDSITLEVVYNEKFYELNKDNFTDIRYNKKENFLFKIAITHKIEGSPNYNQQVVDYYAQEDKYGHRYFLIYNEFNSNVYQIRYISNITEDESIPEIYKELQTKNFYTILIYSFVYLLAFYYNYISVSSIIYFQKDKANRFFLSEYFDFVKDIVEESIKKFDFITERLILYRDLVTRNLNIKFNIQFYLQRSAEDSKKAISYNREFRKQKFNIIDNSAKKVYLLGDLEGDYLMILNWFIDNNLLSKDMNWIAPEGVYVIQCGDQLDKSHHRESANSPKNYRRERSPLERRPDVNVILLFDFLYYESKGKVLSVMGNHDFMAFEKDLSYVSMEDRVFRDNGFFNKGNLLYYVLMAKPFCIRFNDLIISHAGFHKNIVDNYLSLKNETSFDLSKFLKDVNFYPLEGKTRDSLQSEPFYKNVVEEFIWNRLYQKKADCYEPYMDYIIVLGHNTFYDVQYCSKSENGPTESGEHELSDIYVIKTDTGGSTRKCSRNISLFKYSVVDYETKKVYNETYEYNCNGYNETQFKYDVNILDYCLSETKKIDFNK